MALYRSPSMLCFVKHVIRKEANVKQVTMVWGQSWPQGHNLNNYGGGPQALATYQIAKLGHTVLEKKIFKDFPFGCHATHSSGGFNFFE